MIDGYLVTFGAFHCSREHFAELVDALACYRAHQSEQPEGASIYGAGYDDESDGLTAEERDEVVG
jgi:hypothetical protein